MLKDPPPSYEDTEADLSGFPTQKSATASSSQYQAVPLVEADTAEEEDLEDGLGGDSTAPRIQLVKKGPALVSSDTNCVNVHSLERLIRDSLPASSPRFNLKIKGFKKQVQSTSENVAVSELFSFSVPLPTPPSSILYSLDNNAPCLRGGVMTGTSKSPTESNVGSKGWDRSANHFSRTLVANQPTMALETVRDKWNNRVQKMLSPPWLPLYEPVRPRLIEMLQVEGPDTHEATVTLQGCLKSFVEDPSGSTKWLIGVQSVFGWDQGLLLEELNSLMEGVNNESAASRQEPISYLEISLEAPPPFFAFHYLSGHPYSRRIPTEIVKGLLGLLTAIALSLIFWAIFGEAKTKTLLISFISIVILSLAVILSGDVPSVHDSIGVAWSMKRWAKTRFPVHTSKKEVLQVLRAQKGPRWQDEEGQDSRAPRIRLSEEGWYILIGMEESDFVDINKERLKAAMRSRRTGDLSGVWPGAD